MNNARWRRVASTLGLAALVGAAGAGFQVAHAQAASAATPAAAAPAPSASRLIAPGFGGLSRSETVVVMPVDVELFSMSAGGVLEPRADWTEAARGLMSTALADRVKALGLPVSLGGNDLADEFAEQVGLHAAVAASISRHHAVGGVWALPTKAGGLNWTFGDAMQELGRKAGARYGLFVWVRDSYASAERKAAMVLLAFAGIGLTGGIQVGYASLVDLQTGQVVWFNQLARGTGDLREDAPARETIESLVTGLPPVQ
jgi:hypothetical protein